MKSTIPTGKLNREFMRMSANGFCGAARGADLSAAILSLAARRSWRQKIPFLVFSGKIVLAQSLPVFTIDPAGQTLHDVDMLR
jgi:hypothetical protein